MSPHSIGADKMLPTKLDRVERRARADRGSTFNNLGHIVDLEHLRQSYDKLDGSKAVGPDDMTKEKYGKNLDINLNELLLRIRQGSYHPQASRIVEIPKPDGSTRPLAIACFEDKIVQEAVKQVVERIFEPLFLDCSYGFRPKRNAHMALAALDLHLRDQWNCHALLDIDLRKYFNTIPHAQLIQILETKIKDERFMRLIVKMLKAPTLSEDGQEIRNEIGSPQGSILSPLMANIYLHYVLDLWFVKANQEHFGNKAQMVRYADDVVFTFSSMAHAQAASRLIAERLAVGGLTINEAKTQVIECGSQEAAKSARGGRQMPSFMFLGFTHVWGIGTNRKTGQQFWRIKRTTAAKRFRAKVKEVTRMIKKNRHQKILMARVKRIVQGYLNYAAITDNSKRISQFLHVIRRMLFKWLNRRSQKRSFNWNEFNLVLKKIKFPVPKIQVNIFALSRTLELNRNCR
jgi:RNA-directed DNA polymerase